jgi:hypothetical protein
MVNVTIPLHSIKAKGFTGEISGFYRHRSVDQLAVIEPVYQFAFALAENDDEGQGHASPEYA